MIQDPLLSLALPELILVLRSANHHSQIHAQQHLNQLLENTNSEVGTHPPCCVVPSMREYALALARMGFPDAILEKLT